MSLKLILEPEHARQCVSVKTDPPLPEGVVYEIRRIDDTFFESSFRSGGRSFEHRSETYDSALRHARRWLQAQMRDVVRFSRAECATALSSFIRRVARRSSFQFEYKRIYKGGNGLLPERVFGTIDARVRRIWVFGSFARGALTCNDVDLILDVDLSWVGDVHWHQVGSQPIQPEHGDSRLHRWFPELTPKLFGAMRAPLSRGSMVLYRDMFDPDCASLFDMQAILEKEAVLVWEPHLDWNAAIAAIRSSKTASAFPASARSTWPGIRSRK